MYPRPATILNHGIGNVIMNKGIRKIPYKSDMNPEKILFERLNICGDTSNHWNGSVKEIEVSLFAFFSARCEICLRDKI